MLETACAVVSLAATIFIAVLQHFQSKRMENFEHYQDERDERRYAEVNRTQAVEFISRHYADRGLVPLCAIAAMHNHLFNYSRGIYWEFCRLTPEVQNLILEYCNLDLRMKEESGLFDRCIAAVEKALHERFTEDETAFYDGGKYVLRSLSRHAGEKMPAMPIDSFQECLNDLSLSYGGYTPEYKRPIFDVLLSAFESQDASLTPISALEKAYCFKTSSEIEACRFATTVALCVAVIDSDEGPEKKDYGCPGCFDGERIETMEDLFLLAVFHMYTKLLLPNEDS